MLGGVQVRAAPCKEERNSGLYGSTSCAMEPHRTKDEWTQDPAPVAYTAVR